MKGLVVADVTVNTDAEGRFSLNDLHKAAKAAGVKKDIRPNEWLSLKVTEELAEVLNAENPAISPIAVKAGRYGGTFVCKELVYAYAMWCSPTFHLHVIRTFDRLVQQQREAEQALRARQAARLEAPMLADAIKIQRKACGKEILPYHFSNEFDLINRIALGCSSKQFRAEHGIGREEPIRDHLTPCQIKCIEHLQRLNTSLIEIGMDFEQRKAKLNQVYLLRHKRALIDETMRLEA